MKREFMTERVKTRYAAFGAVMAVLSGIEEAKDLSIEVVMSRTLPLIMLDQYVMGYNRLPEELAEISDGSQIPTSFILFASVDDKTHRKLKIGDINTIEPKHYRSGPNIWVVNGGGPQASLKKILEQFSIDMKLEELNFTPSFGKW